MRPAALAFLLATAGCTGAVETAAPGGDAATSDSARSDATPSGRDASPIPPGSSFSGPLPACHWPTSLNPDPPDGAIAAWSVSRTYLICGGCTTNPMGGCAFGGSDSGTSLDDPNATLNGDTACIMGCKPDQYAVTSFEPFFVEPTTAADADILHPPLPTGCTGTLPAVTYIIGHTGFAEGRPGVSCCPCE